MLDASGVAAIFVFILALYLVRTIPDHDLSHHVVDLAAVTRAKPMPGAMKEDAIIVFVTRDGRLAFDNTLVVPEDLPNLIRKAYEAGSERKVYLEVDARAKYWSVQPALDAIRTAGIQDVAVMVEQTRPHSDAGHQ